MQPETAVRSLAGDLRARTPEQLGQLLAQRADLLFRPPRDISELASRVGSPHSVGRALAKCDQFELLVALAAAIGTEPVDVRRISRQLGRPAGGALERLYGLGLLWGPATDRRTVSALRSVLLPRATGPQVAAFDAHVRHFAENPGELISTLAAAPELAREALTMLVTEGSLFGDLAQARRSVTPASAHTPMEWLLARHLVIPIADDQVAVPAEVAAILRSEDPANAVQHVASVTPPPVRGGPLTPQEVDSAGLSGAWQFLRDVEQLCWLWEAQPPSVLRNGSLGARARSATGRALGLAPERVGLLSVVAFEAGLVNHTADRSPVWLPSKSFDRWHNAPAALRWLDVAGPWLLARHAGTDDIGAPWQVAGLASIRRFVLRVLGECPAPPSTDELLARLRWSAPLRFTAESEPVVRSILAEGTALGFIGRGGLTSAGRALLASESPAEPEPEVLATVEAWFPEPVNELIMQADLTAVVPGPPTPALARFLRRCARPESLDVAAIHRFTRDSLAKGLASGLAAADILAELQRYSRTPLPQAFEVLLGDAARAYGSLRAGGAGSYLRSDDPPQLATLLNDPKLAALGLIQIAPTVLVSPASRAELLEHLGRAGVTVSIEGKAGQLVKATKRRAGTPHRYPTHDFDLADPRIVAQAVADLTRPPAGGELPVLEPPEIPSMGPAEVRAALAAATSQRVWIAFDEGLGITRPILADRVLLSGGLLLARSASGQGLTSYPLSRIAGVVPAADE